MSFLKTCISNWAFFIIRKGDCILKVDMIIFFGNVCTKISLLYVWWIYVWWTDVLHTTKNPQDPLTRRIPGGPRALTGRRISRALCLFRGEPSYAVYSRRCCVDLWPFRRIVAGPRRDVARGVIKDTRAVYSTCERKGVFFSTLRQKFHHMLKRI